MTTSGRTAAVFLVSGAFFGFTLLGCSSSKDPAGPGGGNGGGSGPLSSGMTAAEAQYFDGNGGTFQSLEFFIPLISALPVASQVPARAANAAGVSCMRASVVGNVYDFDGEQYTPTAQSGAPTDGARFLIYEVNAEGPVSPPNEIGFLDVTCTAPPGAGARASSQVTSLTFTVDVGGVTRFTGTMWGTYDPPTAVVMDFSGTVFDGAQGALPVVGHFWSPYGVERIQGGAWRTMGLELGDLQLGYNSIRDPSTGESDVYVTADFGPLTGTLLWSVLAKMSANNAGGVSGGYATFQDQVSYWTVACVSGTLDQPQLTDPATASCTQDGSVNGTYPLGSRDDILAAYQSLRRIHGDVHGFLDGLLSLVEIP